VRAMHLIVHFTENVPVFNHTPHQYMQADNFSRSVLSWISTQHFDRPVAATNTVLHFCIVSVCTTCLVDPANGFKWRP